MIEEKFKKVAEYAVSSVPGIERTGLCILDLRERFARVRMPLEGNVNHIGTMYAGSLFTLGEFSGGIIHCVTFDIGTYFPIVKEVSIRFRSPAMSYVTMEVSMTREEADRIQAEADARGKCDFVLDLELKDEPGQVVSLVHGTWQVRKIL